MEHKNNSGHDDVYSYHDIFFMLISSREDYQGIRL